ncbi:hypothetical protein RHGRI_008992 [Rhododendron griersonianum]|uniref:Uncharacterized protein n=1 Tax=Rhododendron griersonianum TaxID=479676 RepID=A0AAV6L4I4_9ERIC|nr:hypothetical protein RHGRI_008992 [Rhododendron griersonianum]
MWCIFLIEGCIYPTHAPMHNACGLPETVRLCPKDFVIWGSLCHRWNTYNNEVKGYIDSSFEGPSLFPSDPAKGQFAEELLSYIDSFNKGVISSFKVEGMNNAGKLST